MTRAKPDPAAKAKPVKKPATTPPPARRPAQAKPRAAAPAKQARNSQAKAGKKGVLGSKDGGKLLSKAEREAPIVEDKPLTPAEQRFIEEYLKDPNGTKAYMAAKPGGTEPAARVSAGRMLAKANVRAEIEKRRVVRAERLQIDGDAIVAEANMIAMADMRELVEYRYLCCRCCYGKDFRYQRTKGERESAFDKHEALQDDRENKALMADKLYTRKVFDEKGGTGFDATKEPHADCPECSGHGVGQIVLKDTKKFSPAAIALYAGVKESKDGLEVKAHSKLDAIEKMIKHLGLYEADNSQKDEGVKLSKEALAAMYADARVAAEEQRVLMVKRRKQFEADDAKERAGGG